MIKNYYSADSEKALLSCILLDPTILHFTEVLSSRLWVYDNKIVYEAMQKLYTDKKGIDIVNIVSIVPNLQEYLRDISTFCMTTANWVDYQTTIKEMFTKRQLYKLTNEIIGSLDGDDAVGELQSKLKRGMDELLISKEGKNFFEIALDVIDGLDDNGEKICKYGYPGLDRHLGGYKEGQLIVIGARPGVGKTAFTVNLIEKIANQDITCVLYSLEMTNKEIVRRMMCGRANITMTEIEKMVNKEKLMEVYTEKANEGFNFKLFDDVYKFSDIEQSIKKEAINNGARLFFIDHIGLIRGMKGDNKNNRLGHISASLKLLAKELKIDIICLSQLNRGSAKGSIAPQLHDLRDSGNIEQDADIVMMLHRDEDYTTGVLNEKEMDLFIRKARNAKMGAIKMDTEMEYMKISEKPFITKKK